MEKADAFVLPSKTASTGDREGTPTVLVEAQASGLPCIATEHAGIPEMIPEANQDLLLPEGDPDALADRLRKLMALSVEELGKIAERGRGKVEADFCLSSEVEKLKNIYWDVIQ
jgi:glycosyltransferase involved in cell wall biosynthesis